MSLACNPYYKELCQQMNPYLAILEIADKSKCISSSLDNRIPMGTAIDFAANNQIPNPKDYPDHRLDRVNEYLTYVLDIQIKSAIIKSYEQSLQKNYLIYDYNGIEDLPRQSRVRVIMNILWDNRPHKEK